MRDELAEVTAGEIDAIDVPDMRREIARQLFPEPLIRRRSAENETSHELPDRRPMLESVSRAAAHDPRVGRRGMPVDDEVLIGRFLVLADPRLEQRRALESREPEREIIPRPLDAVRRRGALAAGRIEDGAARVVRDLEAAPFVARDAVHEGRAVIGPDRHRVFGEAPIAGWRPEEEDFLPRGAHSVADDVGKQRSQPRATGEYKAISRQRTAVR